jgi:D-glycero-D-manno-heptose 1,7-bisphosphate phosphatase
MQRAIFLDRDGTMIHDAGYLSRVEDLRWFPWTIDAIRLLRRAGFHVFVTTNQGGIGLGLYGEDVVEAIHAHMTDTLRRGGADIDGWFHCPHHPRAPVEHMRGPCECRKPAPGMIRQAAARFALDVPRSYVIGDKLLDVELATQAGATGILVRTGSGDDVARAHLGRVPGAGFVAANLMEATSWILGRVGHPQEPA